MAGCTVCGANPARKRGAHLAGKMRFEAPETPWRAVNPALPSCHPFFGLMTSILLRIPPPADRFSTLAYKSLAP